jgi:type II secretory pathway component PulF
MTWGKYYWPYFLILTSVIFLVPEIVALFTNVTNTLSWYARHMLNVSAHMTVHTLAWYISLTAWILFVIVITGHIWWNYA